MKISFLQKLILFFVLVVSSHFAVAQKGWSFFSFFYVFPSKNQIMKKNRRQFSVLLEIKIAT